MQLSSEEDSEGEEEQDRKNNSEDAPAEPLDGKMRVVIRVRPLIQGESTMTRLKHMSSSTTSGQMQVDCQNDTIQLRYDARNKEPKCFKFDKVCDGQVGQSEFFRKIGVRRMVRQVVQGYHATLFAYGQTGAGKTYTMEGYKYQKNGKGQFEPLITQSMETD